jgi:uncharacterized protein
MLAEVARKWTRGVLFWTAIAVALPVEAADRCESFSVLGMTLAARERVLRHFAEADASRRQAEADRLALTKAFALAREAPRLLEKVPAEKQSAYLSAWEDIVRAIARKAAPPERVAMAKALFAELKTHPLDWTVQPRIDRMIDTILGMDAEAVTRRIQGLSPDEIAQRFQGENTWYEYDNSLLLTPYFEFQLALEHLKPKAGQTFVDLGSGMGRMGLYMGMLHPGVRFHGYEIVGERVQEGERAAKELGLQGVHFHEQNMADPNWKPVAADYYYAFNPVSDATFDKILLDLKQQAIRHDKPFKLAVSGPAPYFKLEANGEWLKEITPAKRFPGDDFTRIFEFDPRQGARSLAQSLPDYPAARALKASDRQELEAHMGAREGGLSIYSFPYLWAVGSAADYQVSKKDGLVVLSSDNSAPGYRTYLEPLGGTAAQRASVIRQILQEAKGHEPVRFEYVSEDVAKALEGHAGVTEQTDFAEYVYSTKDLVELQSTKKLRDKKKQVDNFWTAYPGAKYQSLNEHPELLPKVMEFLDHWIAEREKKGDISKAFLEEADTSRRMTQNFLQLGLRGGVLVVNGEIAGYTLGAPVDGTTYGVFLEKANPTGFSYSYQALNQAFAKDLQARGVEFLNRQDDEGVEGLRQAKRSYNPVYMEKHYTVEASSGTTVAQQKPSLPR